jgi:hydrogenase expression/formation protein HypE
MLDICEVRKMREISLAEGAGGAEMGELIRSLRYGNRGKWGNLYDDSATLKLGGGVRLAFTTDSYTVTPIFFPGGDIGKIAACGTINDLAVMGAKPLGMSVALVLEEGLPKADLERIIKSLDSVSRSTGVPVVTGDTKVMEKGKIDGMIVNTSGVGLIRKDGTLDRRPKAGDKVLVSGGLGEHAVAILAKRFGYRCGVRSDAKPLIGEVDAVRGLVRLAKDITRGGLAAASNELCGRHGIGMLFDEADIPVRPSVRKVCEMLGADPLELACEGRLICVVPREKAATALARLKMFNPRSSVIGEITRGRGVAVDTFLGRRTIPPPRGRIVPRIC